MLSVCDAVYCGAQYQCKGVESWCTIMFLGGHFLLLTHTHAVQHPALKFANTLSKLNYELLHKQTQVANMLTSIKS